MYKTEVVQKVKNTHFMFRNFFSESLAV